MSEKSTASSGFGLSTIFGVIFVTLKLVGIIDWPWLWVLAPVWIPWGILAVVLLGILLVAGVIYAVEEVRCVRNKRQRRRFRRMSGEG